MQWHTKRMLLRYLPLVAAFVPLIASFGALAIGAYAGSIERCFPPLDGCMSISAAGRTPPGSYWFKALMMPHSVVLLALFVLSARWLQQLSPDVSQQQRRLIIGSAVIAALALVIYVTFLGTKEPIYQFMRRGGIYFLFVGVFVAELALALALRKIAVTSHQLRLKKLSSIMLILCTVPLLLGLLNLALKAVIGREAADHPENAIEWIASVMLQAYMFVLYIAWRSTGFAVKVETKSE